MAGCPPSRHTNSPETALARSVSDFVGARIFSALLAYLPVTLGAQTICFGLHPFQQVFGGFGWDASALEIPNLFPLPHDLTAHVLDFRADGVPPMGTVTAFDDIAALKRINPTCDMARREACETALLSSIILKT